MEYFINLVLLFFSYSFAGWCIEVILKFRQYHRFINRGFLAGPWLPIYGSGCAFITLAVDGLSMLSSYESSYGSVFAVSFVLCGALEYGASWFMEKRFHARWWDYSQKPMNLHGRIWIGNLMLFQGASWMLLGGWPPGLTCVSIGFSHPSTNNCSGR